MSEVPKPTDTGSAGTQREGTGELVTLSEENPLKGLSIAQRVEGIAAAHPRSMGGEVGANLIAGSFSQLWHDHEETRQELSDARKEAKQALEQLSEARTRAAVLEERSNATRSDRNFRNLSITAGMILVSIGIELYRNKLEKFGFIVGGLGLLLVFFGWFPPKRGTEK